MMKQHLAILCDNKPGVLTHVAGLISRRAINIEYINAGYTEEPDVTRINIVVSVEDQRALNQAILQLARLIDVIKVVNLDETWRICSTPRSWTSTRDPWSCGSPAGKTISKPCCRC